MHIDEGANVQLCQSVRGQMSLHAIFGQGANVRGGGGGGNMSYTWPDHFFFFPKMVSAGPQFSIIRPKM